MDDRPYLTTTFFTTCSVSDRITARYTPAGRSRSLNLTMDVDPSVMFISSENLITSCDKYSEDIDLVQIKPEPIKETIKHIQKQLHYFEKAETK